MTRTTNARIAGFTYLFYIAVGIGSMVLFNGATSGEGTAAKLANVAEHSSDVGVAIVLSLLSCFSALVLGVSLYAITRDEDHDLAMLGLACRVGEGVVHAANLPKTLGLLWLATAGTGAGALEVEAANTIGTFLLIPAGSTIISATFFAVGSTLFSYLLMRGRMVPVPLAWLGILASVLLVVALPLQIARFLKGPVTFYVWIPMFVFEVALAAWLLIKGVATPAKR